MKNIYLVIMLLSLNAFAIQNGSFVSEGYIDGKLYEVRNVIDVRIKTYEYSEEIVLLKLEKSPVNASLSKLRFFKKEPLEKMINMNFIFSGFGPDYSKSRWEQLGLKSGRLPFYGIKKLNNYKKKMLILGARGETNGVSMACRGDSGGPVFYIKNDLIYLVGINQAVLGTTDEFKNSSMEDICKNELAEFLLVIPLIKNELEEFKQDF